MATRERLAACFDSMTLEFEPHLKAAARKYCPTRRVDTRGLARYIVAIIEDLHALLEIRKRIQFP